jgi:PAS domain-containing protein
MDNREQMKEPADGTGRGAERAAESLKQGAAQQNSKVRALREFSRRMKLIFEGAPVGLVMLNERGKVSDVNRAARKMLYAGSGRLKGSSFASFFFDRNDGVQFFEQLRRDGFVSI